MIKMLTGFAAVLLLVVLATPNTFAQAGASEASGEIVDAEGNPMVGVKIVFNPAREPERVYIGKTNKKGKYYVQGLWTPQDDRMWKVTIEKEGFVPVKFRIESRSVNKVLLGAVMEQSLKYGGNVPDFPISKMGHAKVDLTLMPEEEAKQVAIQDQIASGELLGGGEAGEVEQPKADPWIEATTLANEGEYGLSLPKFQEAIKEQPEDPVRLETYAKVLAHEGMFDDAIAAADQALALDPARLDSQLVKSQVYIKMGDMDQARAVLDGARAVAPDDMRIYEQLVYVAQEGGDAEEQVAAHRALIGVEPQRLESWLALGDLYAKTGDLDASAEAYSQVVAIDPDNADKSYYNIAVLILNRDDPGEDDTRRAIDALRRAVEINPDYGPAWHQLGAARLGTGDRKGAVEAFENYLRVSPDGPEAAQLRQLVAALKS